jgi:hypothetical protein
VRRPRIVLVPLLVAAALPLAGCGTADDRGQARAAAQRFFADLQRGDGAAACRELGEETIKQLIQEEQAPCAQAITRLNVAPAAVARVEVFVTSGKVDLANGSSAYLNRSPDGWKLSAVGCRPQGGKPADRPYDCELED